MNSNDATKNEVCVSSFGSNANQIGVARTLMGYFYLHMTDIFGMIPYSEALQGEANLTPKLDTQEEIYKGVIADMKEAYDQMDASSNLNATYDKIYGGNIAKWKKMNATVRMLAAIKLSDVDPAMVSNGLLRLIMMVPSKITRTILYISIMPIPTMRIHYIQTLSQVLVKTLLQIRLLLIL